DIAWGSLRGSPRLIPSSARAAPCFCPRPLVGKRRAFVPAFVLGSSGLGGFLIAVDASRPTSSSRRAVSKEELVEAYLEGKIDRRTFVRRLVGAGVSLAAAGAYAELLRPQRAGAAVRSGKRTATVPNPTVTGPIPSTVPPGDPSHDYP